MAKISAATVQRLLHKGDDAGTSLERGRALEEVVCYVLTRVPGVSVALRDKVNAFGTEELDVGLWNERSRSGFHFLPNVIPVECKNWDHPVTSVEIGYFNNRLRNGGCSHGFLFAASGITGNPSLLTAANFELATALKDGVRIIVITRLELEQLTSSADLVLLAKRKLCDIAVCRTSAQ